MQKITNFYRYIDIKRQGYLELKMECSKIYSPRVPRDMCSMDTTHAEIR